MFDLRLRAMSAVNLLSSLKEKPNDESPKDGSKYEGKWFIKYSAFYLQNNVCIKLVSLDFSRESGNDKDCLQNIHELLIFTVRPFAALQ